MLIIQSIWLSYSNIPQEIIIDTSKLLKYPKEGFNTFGIYCWHAYVTNPKIIELQISDNYQNNNNSNFKLLGIFELEMRPGKQLFPLNYNNIMGNKNIKYNIKAIKLIVRETYGGNRTYINQVMFYEQNAEKVKDLICGNELNKIYKNQKKLIQEYSNSKLNNKMIIKKNNSFSGIPDKNKINQRNNKKEHSMNYSNEENLNQYSQNNNKKKKNNKIIINDKYYKKENEEDIYNTQGEIIDIEKNENDEEEIEENNSDYNNKSSDNTRNYNKINNEKIKNKNKKKKNLTFFY